MSFRKNPLTLALDEKKCLLELVRWQGEDGGPKYAYLLMKKNLLPEFRKAMKERNVDLASFGVIVAHGNGSEPPEGCEEKILHDLMKAA